MQPTTQPTTSDLRTAYEQALADEERLEQETNAAELLAADDDPEHIRAFHAIESEYWASWGRTTDACTRWLNQTKREQRRMAA